MPARIRKYILITMLCLVLVFIGHSTYKRYQLQKEFNAVVYWVEKDCGGRLGVLEGWLTIDLSGTRVDDLKPIKKYNKVWALSVSETGVKDLTPLQDHSYLKELYLANSQVDDLSPLFGLTNLRKLDISGLKLEKDQIEKLIANSPTLELIK